MDWEQELADQIKIHPDGVMVFGELFFFRMFSVPAKQQIVEVVTTGVKDLVRRVLDHHLYVLPMGDPPITEGDLEVSERKNALHVSKGFGTIQGCLVVEKCLRMIRWQQATIAFLARETDYKEATDKAWRDGYEDGYNTRLKDDYEEWNNRPSTPGVKYGLEETAGDE